MSPVTTIAIFANGFQVQSFISCLFVFPPRHLACANYVYAMGDVVLVCAEYHVIIM